MTKPLCMDIRERAMTRPDAGATVYEVCPGGEHIAARFFAGFVFPAPDAFAFEQVEEAFRDGSRQWAWPSGAQGLDPNGCHDGACRGPDCAVRGTLATHNW